MHPPERARIKLTTADSDICTFFFVSCFIIISLVLFFKSALWFFRSEHPRISWWAKQNTLLSIIPYGRRFVIEISWKQAWRRLPKKRQQQKQVQTHWSWSVYPNLAFHWSGLFNCEMISKICLFLFIDFLLLRGYNYSQEMGFLLSNVFRLEKGARFFFYVHYII